MDVTERFLRLVSFSTASDESSGSCPSTPGQLELAAELVRQMKEIGIADAHVDKYGYVYGTVPANTDRPLPVYGLIAHMDTSPDAPGSGIKARVTDVYSGGDIVLNERLGTVLSPKEYPSLDLHRGKRLIVTDGTTLLGADDKAGVAEILAAAEMLIGSEKEHGKIRIAFTPDEEIGRGADFFDISGFAADFAYTVDGGRLGEIEYENFNAAAAHIEINGRSIHPGDAKGKMINALLVVTEFNSLLPEKETPYYTEGYEGFFHLTDISGKVEHASADYIIRDHDTEKFENRKVVMREAAEEINRRYGEGTAVLTLTDSYYNMRLKIEPHMFLIDQVHRAFAANGVRAYCVPIRGGTDGARLSYEGLPCPNICTGGENYHSRFEYCVVEDMQKIAETLAYMLLHINE